jgi:hypothetical protein
LSFFPIAIKDFSEDFFLGWRHQRTSVDDRATHTLIYLFVRTIVGETSVIPLKQQQEKQQDKLHSQVEFVV